MGVYNRAKYMLLDGTLDLPTTADDLDALYGETNDVAQKVDRR